MIITAVERMPKRRGRVAIYIDGIVAAEVARDTADRLGLRPGTPITQAEVDAMVAADVRRQALAIAIAMLARRPHSEREVQRRLARHKFDAAIADEIVAKLRGARLLDDAEFARAWTQSRDAQSPRGQRLIVQELRAAGVETTIASEAAAEVSEPDAAYRIASKRMRSLVRLDHASFRNRLGSFLQRRGFGWEVARTTVDRCWREISGDAATGDEFAE